MTSVSTWWVSGVEYVVQMVASSFPAAIRTRARLINVWSPKGLGNSLPAFNGENDIALLHIRKIVK